MKTASLLAKLTNLYSTVIVIRIFLSWLPQLNSYDGYGSQGRPVYDFLRKITDPYMNLFRSKKFTVGRIDFSTLFALMTLSVVHSLLSLFAAYGTITLGMIIAIVLNGWWDYILKFFVLAIVILLAIRWFIGRKPSAGSYAWKNTIDAIIAAPVNFVFKLFFSGKTVGEQKLVGVSLIFYIGVFIILRVIFVNLVPYLYTL